MTVFLNKVLEMLEEYALLISIIGTLATIIGIFITVWSTIASARTRIVVKNNTKSIEAIKSFLNEFKIISDTESAGEKALITELYNNPNTNSERHIITDDLKCYDLTTFTALAITLNIQQGIKYYYYFPKKEFYDKKYECWGNAEKYFKSYIESYYDKNIKIRKNVANCISGLFKRRMPNSRTYNGALLNRFSLWLESDDWFVSANKPEVRNDLTIIKRGLQKLKVNNPDAIIDWMTQKPKNDKLSIDNIVFIPFGKKRKANGGFLYSFYYYVGGKNGPGIDNMQSDENACWYFPSNHFCNTTMDSIPLDVSIYSVDSDDYTREPTKAELIRNTIKPVYKELISSNKLVKRRLKKNKSRILYYLFEKE